MLSISQTGGSSVIESCFGLDDLSAIGNDEAVEMGENMGGTVKRSECHKFN